MGTKWTSLGTEGRRREPFEERNRRRRGRVGTGLRMRDGGNMEGNWGSVRELRLPEEVEWPGCQLMLPVSASLGVLCACDASTTVARVSVPELAFFLRPHRASLLLNFASDRARLTSCGLVSEFAQCVFGSVSCCWRQIWSGFGGYRCSGMADVEIDRRFGCEAYVSWRFWRNIWI